MNRNQRLTSASQRLLDLLILAGIAATGLLALYWARQHQFRKPEPSSVLRPTASPRTGDRTQPPTRFSVNLQRKSPFDLTRLRTPASLARESANCQLVITKKSLPDSTTESYLPAKNSRCFLRVPGSELRLVEAWFDPNGLRSASATLPASKGDADRTWASLIKDGLRTPGIGEIYCWSDACARRAENIIGIWRQGI